MSGHPRDFLSDIEDLREELERERRRGVESAAERDRLAALLDCLPDAVYLHAPDGARIYANTSARKLLGLDDTWMPVTRLPGSAPCASSGYHSNSDDARHRCQHSSRHPCCTTTILRDGLGGIVGAAHVIRSMAEEHASGHDLAFPDSFPNNNPYPVLRFSAQGRVLFVNQAGRPLLDKLGIAPGGTLQGEFLEAVLAAQASNEPRQLDVELSDRTCLLQLVPLRDAGYVNAYGMDVTEMRRTQEVLRRREREFRALFENSPDTVVRVNKDLVRAYVNPAIQGISGLPVEAFAGKPIEEPDIPERADAIRNIREAIPLVFASGREELRVSEYPTPGGMTWLETRFAPEFAADGTVESVLAITRDVTTAKRLEMELRVAKLQAEQASQAKSDFLARMSHEIRTPLGGIIGLTEPALATVSEPKSREYFQLIATAGATLLLLVNDILDLSKVEAGKLELERLPFTLRAEIDAALQPLAPEACRKGLLFTTRIDPSLPEVLVGDGLRLRQVLANLAVNALKFTDSGEVRVEVERDRGAETAPGEVRLIARVSDTGIGIPAKSMETIFDSFAQAHCEAHGLFGGTGLGLAISRQLAELMGGRIWAESTPGRGSTFTFTCVLGLAENGALPGLSVLSAKPDARRRRRILLAEDNKINQLVLGEFLREQGHEVSLAENGHEALEALAGQRFDLVLMDANMPVMDGEAATRAIRSGEVPGVDPALPIVALTAYALQGDRERFLAMGMDDYVSKPVDFGELLAVMAKVLERRGKE